MIFAICDEVAFWPYNPEGASSDREVIRALRPALATTSGPLLAITSPYAKRGLMFDVYKTFFGKNDPRVLVWRAPTKMMNPKFNPVTIAVEMARDKASARSEYLAEFREDIADFLSNEVLDAATMRGRKELLPRAGLDYSAFTDPSGGSGSDSFAVAVAHLEGHAVVLDAVREVPPPFSPERTVEEFCQFLRAYRIFTVVGDAYAGSWPTEAFEKHGIQYRVSELTRSQIYLEALPLFNSGAVQLLDDERLRNQLAGLERRTSRAGKDSVDHGVGGHDDVANAVCGALTLAASSAAGELGLVEYLKGVTKGELPDPFAVPSLQERLAQRRAEIAQCRAAADAQCVDPMAQYNQPPAQANASFVPRTRQCECGGTMQNEAADRFMYTCAKCGMRISINTDFMPSVGPSRAEWLAEHDRGDRWQRGLRAFGRFGRR